MTGNFSLKTFTFPPTSPNNALWEPKTDLVAWAWFITSSICIASQQNTEGNISILQQWQIWKKVTNLKGQIPKLFIDSSLQCESNTVWSERKDKLEKWGQNRQRALKINVQYISFQWSLDHWNIICIPIRKNGQIYNYIEQKRIDLTPDFRL